MLNLKHLATYHGPNPYSVEPVIVLDLKVPPEIGPKVEHLCGLFRAHFSQSFEQAEFNGSSSAVVLGQTASHWALWALNEVRGYLHAAGAMPSPQGARVWLGFHDEAVSRAALQLAFNALLQAERPDVLRGAVQRELEKLWDACGRRHPDFLARTLMQAASANDIPVRPFLQGTRLWQYGWGSRSKVFLECAPNENGGKRLTADKIVSKATFATLGAPTPEHRLVSKNDELEKAAESIGWPCVVKPVQGSKGGGVTAGIRTVEALRAAFVEASRQSRGPVMVEAFVPGHDHRLMVAERRLLCAIRREPSFVVGDGTRTIMQLLEMLNSSRSANFVKSRYLRQVPIDAVLLRHLASQDVSLDTIPPPGVRITLRSNANLSTGGFATDVTKVLHPGTARMAELIVESMGYVTAGLDFITADISKSFLEMGAFIEINGNPGIGMVMSAGNDPVFVGEQVLGRKPGRIPVTLVVLNNEALSEAQRWLQSQEWPAQSAWACGRFASVDGAPLKISLSSPWAAVDSVLKHQSVGSVSIFCSGEEIVRWGLPVDRADRVVLCNVELPDEWSAVLSANATKLERSADWRQASMVGAATPGEKRVVTP